VDEKKNGVLRHATMYLVARGVPGLFAFLAIPLYTHLLLPQDYGRYALLAGTVAMLNALIFMWVRLALVRYLPVFKDRPGVLKSTILTAELALIAVLGLITLLAAALPALHAWRAMLLPCWALLALQAIFELFLEYTRAAVEPRQYLILLLSRSILATGLGCLFIEVGFGWWGPVCGLAAGMLLPAIYAYRRDWKHFKFEIDRNTLATICRYGIPLSITVALTLVISTSDRFLIAYYLGEAQAGLYSVAVDFTTQTLTLLMMVIYLAMFPLAVRAWENSGPDAARRKMRDNAALLMAVGVPSVAALWCLSPNVARCFFGRHYQSTAAEIIPIVALGSFVAGLKNYHFDSAFQFVHRTIHQVWIVLIAAAANVGLNLLVITRYGIIGSAIASIAAYVLSITLTVWFGRRHFALPFPIRPLLKVLASAAFMLVALSPVRDLHGPLFMVEQVVIGLIAYASCLLILDFLGLREALRVKLAGSRAFPTHKLTIYGPVALAGNK
jgi:O-antigen/teichoic acid export membrane protein